MMHRGLVGSTTLNLALVCFATSLAILACGSDAQSCGCTPGAPYRRRREVGSDGDGNSNFIKVDDMLMSREDFELSMSSETSRSSAQPEGYISCRRLWPNGKLYYRFSGEYPSNYRDEIRQALQALSSRTNGTVEFIESDSELEGNQHRVLIVYEQGCWSYVGRVSMDQEMSLSAGCIHDFIIQHEFMHALGLSHEQSRSDRDEYVRILWDNIGGNQCHNFYKTCSIPTDFPAYDYHSIMHYPSNAFSCRRGLNTIVTRNGTVIGSNQVLTDLDVAKIMYLYSPERLQHCFSSDVYIGRNTPDAGA